MGIIEKGVFGVLQITFGIVNYLLYAKSNMFYNIL